MVMGMVRVERLRPAAYNLRATSRRRETVPMVMRVSFQGLQKYVMDCAMIARSMVGPFMKSPVASWIKTTMDLSAVTLAVVGSV